MNIVLITSSYLPRRGGLERACSSLAATFKKQGHQILVVTQKYPRTLQGKEYIGNMEIKRYVFFDPKTPRNTFRSCMAYLYTLALAPFNFFRFASRIRVFNPDIVYYHFVGGPTFFLLLYRFLFPVKIIVSVHGEDVRTLPHESKIGRAMFRLIAKRADTVVANSLSSLRKACSLESSIENKSQVIHNGINPQEFSCAKAYQHVHPYLLCVARLVKTKGVDILIEAFSQIALLRPDMDLIIVGDGPQRHNLEGFVCHQQLDKRVSFLGSLAKNMVAELLQGCEVVVVPSRHEQFGMVILEAMACKKIVVATRSGGPQEILQEGITGLLVEADNVQALVTGIETAVNDSEIRRTIFKNLEHYDTRFDIQQVAEQYLCLSQK